MGDDIDARYEVPRTAEFIRARAYTRVALQVIPLPRRLDPVPLSSR
jgi:hypothetical protein